jgi:hypothetical protein
MTLLFSIIGIAIIIALVKIIQYFKKRSDKKRIQKRTDQNVELQINECSFEEITIDALVRHSDGKKVARMVSSRICDYIKLAIHPGKLSKIFQNLNLFTYYSNEISDKEVELSALIKHYTLSNLDTHNMNVYQSQVCEDKEGGFEQLNKSFLTKVENKMLVWSSHLN